LLHRLQPLTDAVVALLTVHIIDTQAHAAHDGVGRTIVGSLVAAGGGQSGLNAVGTGQRTVVGYRCRTALNIERNAVNTRQSLNNGLHLVGTLLTTHTLYANGQRVGITSHSGCCRHHEHRG